MSAARELGLLAAGWTTIIVLALLIRWLDHLYSRWTYRQHRRRLGKLPPRRVW